LRSVHRLGLFGILAVRRPSTGLADGQAVEPQAGVHEQRFEYLLGGPQESGGFALDSPDFSFVSSLSLEHRQGALDGFGAVPVAADEPHTLTSVDAES
jgi:hypothetical protein